jgi:hypothetical protein
MKSQHFVLVGDGTLRFFDETAGSTDDLFCVTNSNPVKGSSASLQVTLQRCAAKVEQHWAYHGHAPGNDDGNGELYYGDWENALGVISKLKN